MSYDGSKRSNDRDLHISTTNWLNVELNDMFYSCSGAKRLRILPLECVGVVSGLYGFGLG